MNDRQDDARVAEIMGACPDCVRSALENDDPDEGIVHFGCDAHGQKIGLAIENYTTDPAADYEVLRWVRGNLNEQEVDRFAAALDARWAAGRGLDELCNPVPWWMRYEPGDYARALLKVMEP